MTDKRATRPWDEQDRNLATTSATIPSAISPIPVDLNRPSMAMSKLADAAEVPISVDVVGNYSQRSHLSRPLRLKLAAAGHGSSA